MTPIEALFYDGKSSQSHRVLIDSRLPGHLRVTGDGINFDCALDEVRISSRVGNTRRHIYFADGSQCETKDNDAVDKMLSGVRSEIPNRLLHHWESRIGYAVLAFVITLALLWVGVNYGIPALAKQIAFRMPASTETLLGQEALAGLDGTVLQPSKLSPSRQTELKQLFTNMTSDIEGAENYRLELRSSHRMGPNAFALPSGIVVVTDALVEIAKDDNELIAVLAHELGHLQRRHSLRMLLQDSATVVLVIAVTGDVSSVISLGAGLPSVLLQTKYSRDFEREADDYSYEYLQSHKIPTESFINILERIQAKAGGGNMPDFLSNHPSTSERIERFRGAN